MTEQIIFKKGQNRWSHLLEREVVWTFLVFIEDAGYEFELQEGQIASVFQFEGEIRELTEEQINYIFEQWKS